MSSYSGTQTEALYAYSAAATAVNGTSEANAQATYPALAIPAGYFTGGGSKSRVLSVTAWGQMTCGSTATNLTVSARILTTETWSAAGILLGSTAAAAMATSVTASFWRLDIDVFLRTESVGAASTVAAIGLLQAPAGLSATGGQTSIPATNTGFTNATVDAQTQYYFFLSALVSQTTGSPTFTVQGLRATGWN